MTTIRVCALRQLTHASYQVAARPALLVLSRTAPSLFTTRAFSMTPGRFSAGAFDALFAQKLAEAFESEKKNAQPEEPCFLKSFKEEGVWTIKNVKGSDKVTFTRRFGNESIDFMFSVLGLRQVPSLIPVLFVISKDGVKGSLCVSATYHGGMFGGLKYGNDGKCTLAALNTLDEPILEALERWLDERGVNESLVKFIPQYAEYREQKEYMVWVENVNNFVEA